MTDFNSTKTLCYCIPCSLEDFVDLQHMLEAERQRVTDEDLGLCLEMEYFDGDLFIPAVSFDGDNLPENVASAIDKLLRLPSQEYVALGYPLSDRRFRAKSHEGGVTLTYNDGTPTTIKFSEGLSVMLF